MQRFGYCKLNIFTHYYNGYCFVKDEEKPHIKLDVWKRRIYEIDYTILICYLNFQLFITNKYLTKYKFTLKYYISFKYSIFSTEFRKGVSYISSANGSSAPPVPVEWTFGWQWGIFLSTRNTKIITFALFSKYLKER